LLLKVLAKTHDKGIAPDAEEAQESAWDVNPVRSKNSAELHFLVGVALTPRFNKLIQPMHDHSPAMTRDC